MSWFRNEWLFKWHSIKGDRPVPIDTFDGRHAAYSGLRFEGSPHNVYWTAITRGVRKEVDELFRWIDDAVRTYPRTTAEKAIDECADLVSSFVAALRQHVIEKDRILRGDGIKFPAAHDFGDWLGLGRDEILHRAADLKQALFPPATEVLASEMPKRSEEFKTAERAVAGNGAQVVLSIETLSMLVDQRIAVLEAERPNSSEEITRRDDELAECRALQATLSALRNAVAEYKVQPAAGRMLEETAGAFSRGVQGWWEKRAISICDSTAELTMFLAAVSVCSAVGVAPTIAAIVAGALFGRKSALSVLKNLAKKVRGDSGGD